LHLPLLRDRVHTQRYVEYVQALSKDSSKGIHKAGPDVAFGPGATQQLQPQLQLQQQPEHCSFI
jgi:hypothetical protein